MDKFYRQIVSRLDEHLDPKLFEACACDLLRAAYPGLVPISGGHDRGMDGAIADFEAEAFPLVCTTGKDVARNLAKNLDSHLKRRYPRRKVVLATSRSLTAPQRFKLEELARDMGFTLVQIHEQNDIAQRLYRNPRWYRELGLTGTPSALSVVPATRRPLIEIEPVGRDADLEWLRTTAGDRVVSGPPGSGKTFLLYHLVRGEQWGLFLVSNDRTAIADAIREDDPKVVIVDDAHLDPSRLEHLKQLRADLGASFSIVAATWDGDRDRVAAALGPASQIHKLELLTRDEIVEVIRRAGLSAHDSLMKELVDQAANKPGLAVTLAVLALRGDWSEVLEGRALTRSLMAFFEDLGPSAWSDVLACFAIGGDRGMHSEVAARFLGLSRQRIRERAGALAAGGVLSEAGDDALAVWPRALRSALLREVFFPGPGPKHDYRELLENTPSFEKAVAAVVDARRYGAAILPETLRELVVRAGSQKVWEEYTALGESEALWALSSYPGDCLDLAVPALHLAPSATIPKLLQRSAEGVATNERVEVARLHRHPLGLLRIWLLNLETSPEEGIRRRWLLVRTVKEFLQGGGDSETGTNALSLALSPVLKGESQDPDPDSDSEMNGEFRQRMNVSKSRGSGARSETSCPSSKQTLGVLSVRSYVCGLIRNHSCKSCLKTPCARCGHSQRGWCTISYPWFREASDWQRVFAGSRK